MAAQDRRPHADDGRTQTGSGGDPSTGSKILIFAVLFAVLLGIVAAGVTFTSNEPASQPPAATAPDGRPSTGGG